MQRIKGIIQTLHPADENGYLGSVKATGGSVWNDTIFPIRSLDTEIPLFADIEVSFLPATIRVEGKRATVAIGVDILEPKPEFPVEETRQKVQRTLKEIKAKKEEDEGRNTLLLSILSEVRQEYSQQVGGVKTASGKGGPEHRFLQLFVSQAANRQGWLSTIEKPIVGGREATDVVIEKNGVRIAVEISISTIYTEEKNLAKNFEAGFSYVVSIAKSQKQLEKIIRRARKSLTDEQFARVWFMLPDAFPDFLQNKTPELMQRYVAGSGEGGTGERLKIVRGYRVRVTHLEPISDGAHKVLAQTLACVILRNRK